MRNIQLQPTLSNEDIKEKMNTASTIAEFKRWQSLYMIQKKEFRAAEIADLIAISERTVNQWVYYYNRQGAQGIASKERGGRRQKSSFMSLEEETVFLKNLQDEAQQGHLVIAQTVKAQVEKQLNRKVSKDYVYDLFHRHGWRKIVPRPKHPKNDKPTQEAFKKNSRSYWTPL
jgi:transposase